MDRRALFNAMLGNQHRTTALLPTISPSPIFNSGLQPYTGDWTFEQAAHLLRRTIFGPTFEQMLQATDLGLDETIALLLQDIPLPEPPLNINVDDPLLEVGSTWVEKAIPRGDEEAINARRNSLRSWMIELFLKEELSIREKMTIFWMDHFVVEFSIIQDPNFMYKHVSLMQTYAIGDFRALVKEVTISPAMLRYLDGNKNDKDAPNENYARELFELFTVGKKDLAETGDYTTFTEQDVSQAAKVLTGWKDEGFYKKNDSDVTGSKFYPELHDIDTKIFSHRFEYATISNGGEEEYAQLIDMILRSPYVATFLSERLYRYFVYYDITDQIRQDIIEPLAQVIRDNDYHIKPALETLLKSEHFFDVLNMGPMIKNPANFALSLIKQFKVEIPEDLTARHFILRKIYEQLKGMQMELLDPPDVAGWKAYYQTPLYYRIWINSVTLPVRAIFSNTITTVGFNFGTTSIKVDVLEFINITDDPSDPNVVIRDFAKFLFPRPLSTEQLDGLKEVLVPGLPDFEWTIEYEEYRQQPNNQDLATSIEKKLRDLLFAMVNMPEYYLC